jgi:hypothetical protein
VNFAAVTKDDTNDIPSNENIFFADGTGIRSTETGNPKLLTFTSVASADHWLDISNSVVAADETFVDITFGSTAQALVNGITVRAESSATVINQTWNTDNALFGFDVNETESNTFIYSNLGMQFAADTVGDISFFSAAGDLIFYSLQTDAPTLVVSGSSAGENYVSITGTTAGAEPILMPEGDTPGISLGASYFQFTEMTAPSTAPANSARLFVRDNGSGKTQLCAIFASGAVQVIVTEP